MCVCIFLLLMEKNSWPMMVLNDIKVQIKVSSGKFLFHTWVFLKYCVHLYLESFQYNLPLWCNVIAFLRFYQTSSDIKWVIWQISLTKFVFVYRFQVSLRISIFCTHTITFFGESRLLQRLFYFAIETEFKYTNDISVVLFLFICHEFFMEI